MVFPDCRSRIYDENPNPWEPKGMASQGTDCRSQIYAENPDPWKPKRMASHGTDSRSQIYTENPNPWAAQGMVLQAILLVYFPELFEVNRDRGSRNKVFAVSSWESPVVKTQQQQIAVYRFSRRDNEVSGYYCRIGRQL